MIGRKFADAEVQADLKHFPFKVIDRAGKPYAEVTYKGEVKQFVSKSVRTAYRNIQRISSRLKKFLPWCL